MTFGIFFKVWINYIFNFTVVILILPYLSIVVRWNTPVNSLIVTKGRVPKMDILLVINPFSPCTEFYTICSHKRCLLGVLSDNRRSSVLSEIFKVIKWFWWSRWWRDCNIYIYIYIYICMLTSFSSLSTLAWLRWSHICEITWGGYMVLPPS